MSSDDGKRQEITVTLMVGKAVELTVEVKEVVVAVKVAKVVVEEAVGGRGGQGH